MTVRAKTKGKKQAQLERYHKMGIANFKHDATVMPKRIFTSDEYRSLSGNAIKILHSLMLQYNGFNNGDLSAPLTQSVETFGMTHKTLQRGIRELLDKQFIIVSREGNRKQCTLYALTFYAIDECKGKHDLQPTNYPCEKWKVSRQQLEAVYSQNYFSKIASIVVCLWLSKMLFLPQMQTADVLPMIF